MFDAFDCGLGEEGDCSAAHADSEAGEGRQRRTRRLLREVLHHFTTSRFWFFWHHDITSDRTCSSHIDRQLNRTPRFELATCHWKRHGVQTARPAETPCRVAWSGHYPKPDGARCPWRVKVYDAFSLYRFCRWTWALLADLMICCKSSLPLILALKDLSLELQEMFALMASKIHELPELKT